MSQDNLRRYRENLAHVVRPDDPSDRTTADHVQILDFEALYLYDALVEYAAYEAPDAETEGIALAYAEYINYVVRDEGRGKVNLYAHTEEAKAVLDDALDARVAHCAELHEQIGRSITQAFEDEL